MHGIEITQIYALKKHPFCDSWLFIEVGEKI